jgi:hypothetical protein
MTKQDVLEFLRPLDQMALHKWLADLGLDLTIGARSGYPIGDTPGKITHLIGFNEIQHQVYGKVRCLQSGDDWPLEEFLDNLFEKAAYYKIENDFGWALKHSLHLPG